MHVDASADASTLPQVTLRPLAPADFPLLVQWINEPHVARWWDGTADMASVNTKYSPRLDMGSPTRVFVIQIDNFSVGMIQCYRHRDYPDWERTVGIEGGAGIDYLIGDTRFTGKGIGAQAIREIAKIAFAIYPEIKVVLSVPQKENRASWRALEKAGFDRVDERKLESDCPSDAGVSYIYAFSRDRALLELGLKET
jgi:aminoglycoside 6'-N-acetyltransferase